MPYGEDAEAKMRFVEAALQTGEHGKNTEPGEYICHQIFGLVVTYGRKKE